MDDGDIRKPPLEVTSSFKQNKYDLQCKYDVYKSSLCQDMVSTSLVGCLCAKQALYPRDADSSMQKYVHTQIDANTKTPHFHDEFKVQLPTNLSPDHHLLFTFFHVELQTKLEAPKPVCIYFYIFSTAGTVLLCDSLYFCF